MLAMASILVGASLQAQGARGDDGQLISRNACRLHSLDHATYRGEYRRDQNVEIVAIDSAFRTLRRPTAADSNEYRRSRDDAAAGQPIPEARYDLLFRSGRYQCERIAYRSDGLKVIGYRYGGAPHHSGKHPVILFLRGGNREFGKVDEPWMRRFRVFLDSGYVVLATQYRGNDGGEGREELGGRDVHDVLNLVPLARGDSTLDHDNVYAFGVSRGGMMAYLAIRSGLAVRAAVIQAGPTDLARTEALRPGFEKEVYAPLVPGWPRTRAAFYADRSAIHWADRLNVPMLILHGTQDWRVDPQDALALATRLQRAGKRFELVMYEGDDHYLFANRDDVDRRMFAWFAKFRQGVPAERTAR
jgi:dipeptidyl aminopeptidase/acylaminoacyl peptidase